MSGLRPGATSYGQTWRQFVNALRLPRRRHVVNREPYVHADLLANVSRCGPASTLQKSVVWARTFATLSRQHHRERMHHRDGESRRRLSGS